MNRRIGSAVCAALALGGLLVVLLPQHALTIGRVAATTVVVMAGGLVLGAVGPFVAREVPVTGLDVVATPGAAPLDPHGLRDARRDLDRPASTGSLSNPVRQRLAVAARVRLHRLGIDVDDDRSRARGAALLQTDTWALVIGQPETSRLGVAGRDARTSAALVHRVLDELDRLDDVAHADPRTTPTLDLPATTAGTGARHGSR